MKKIYFIAGVFVASLVLAILPGVVMAGYTKPGYDYEIIDRLDVARAAEPTAWANYSAETNSGGQTMLVNPGDIVYFRFKSWNLGGNTWASYAGNSTNYSSFEYFDAFDSFAPTAFDPSPLDVRATNPDEDGDDNDYRYSSHSGSSFSFWFNDLGIETSEEVGYQSGIMEAKVSNAAEVGTVIAVTIAVDGGMENTMNANFLMPTTYADEYSTTQVQLVVTDGVAGIYEPPIGGIEINDCEELQLIGNDYLYPLSGDYVLGNNIDCSDTVNWNDEYGFIPLGSEETPFTGTFNGNGKVISDLYMDASNNTGLFSYVQAGEIYNLGLTAIQVYGYGNTGGLAGVLDGASTIENSYVTGQLDGWSANVGGLVGYAKGNSSIIDCYSDVAVEGEFGVGGLVGRMEGFIENSYALGSVTSEWGFGIGGLVGKMYGGEITQSYATGEVVAYADDDFDPNGYFSSFAGGLVGYSASGNINLSYATGDVTGAGMRIGGLVGGSSGTVENCYATGDVIGSGEYDPEYNLRMGGLVGGLTGQVLNSYAVGDVSGYANIGGLVGWADGGSVADSFEIGLVTADVDYEESGGLVGYFTDSGVDVTNGYWNDTGTYPEGFDCYYDGDEYYWGNDGCTSVANNEEFFYDVANDPMAEWDFDSIWLAQDGDYPILAWQVDNPPYFVDVDEGVGQVNVTNGQIITTNPYIITVRPADDVEVERVEFYVDGVLICTDYTADANGVYSCAWDTSLYHSDIRIIAYDNNGNPSAPLERYAIIDLDGSGLPNTGISAWAYLLGLLPVAAIGIRKLWRPSNR